MIFQQNYNQDLPYIPYNSANKDYARFNRKNPTKAESLMWNIVLKWNKTWYRFVHQKTLWWFIADFYCSKLLLVIEVDGWYHSEIWEEDENMKEKLRKDEWYTEVFGNTEKLKMLASDGKRHPTDAANTKTILRIIQSIPSPNAEPFKQWLASLWNERVEESNDPELWITRARARACQAELGKKPRWLSKNFYWHDYLFRYYIIGFTL